MSLDFFSDSKFYSLNEEILIWVPVSLEIGWILLIQEVMEITWKINLRHMRPAEMFVYLVFAYVFLEASAAFFIHIVLWAYGILR